MEYVPDNLYLFERHDREQERRNDLRKRQAELWNNEEMMEDDYDEYH